MNPVDQSLNAFIQENLIQEEGAQVSVRDILITFREWHRYNPSQKAMNKAELVSRLTARYGQLDSLQRSFSNVRLVMEEEKELNEIKERLSLKKSSVDFAESAQKLAVTAAENALSVAFYLKQQASRAIRNTDRARAEYQTLQNEIVSKMEANAFISAVN